MELQQLTEVPSDRSPEKGEDSDHGRYSERNQGSMNQLFPIQPHQYSPSTTWISVQFTFLLSWTILVFKLQASDVFG